MWKAGPDHFPTHHVMTGTVPLIARCISTLVDFSSTIGGSDFNFNAAAIGLLIIPFATETRGKVLPE